MTSVWLQIGRLIKQQLAAAAAAARSLISCSGPQVNRDDLPTANLRQPLRWSLSERRQTLLTSKRRSEKIEIVMQIKGSTPDKDQSRNVWISSQNDSFALELTDNQTSFLMIIKPTQAATLIQKRSSGSIRDVSDVLGSFVLPRVSPDPDFFELIHTCDTFDPLN